MENRIKVPSKGRKWKGGPECELKVTLKVEIEWFSLVCHFPLGGA